MSMLLLPKQLADTPKWVPDAWWVPSPTQLGDITQ